MPIPEGISNRFHLIRVRPTILGRLRAEWLLRRLVSHEDLLFCFGNLPPIFSSRGQVVLFLQNRYMVERLPITGFPFKKKIRLYFERKWFQHFLRLVDRVVVQSPSMRDALLRLLEEHKPLSPLPIAIRPFLSNTYLERGTERDEATPCTIDFIYVGSGEPHKNHLSLIRAWLMLAEDGLFPSLALTLDDKAFPDLCAWIKQEAENNKLNVQNFGSVPAARLKELYSLSSALIYPSSSESMGLPLVEARNLGLSVVAAELDYVRDILDPDETFDPSSPRSIARAVKRFRQVHEPREPIISADNFIQRLLKEKG